MTPSEEEAMLKELVELKSKLGSVILDFIESSKAQGGEPAATCMTALMEVMIITAKASGLVPVALRTGLEMHLDHHLEKTNIFSYGGSGG